MVLEVPSHLAGPQKAAAGVPSEAPVLTLTPCTCLIVERLQGETNLKSSYNTDLYLEKDVHSFTCFFSFPSDSVPNFPPSNSIPNFSPFLLQPLLHANALHPTFLPVSSLIPFHANDFSCFPLSFQLVFTIFIASQAHLGLPLFVYGACWLGSVFIQRSVCSVVFVSPLALLSISLIITKWGTGDLGGCFPAE